MEGFFSLLMTPIGLESKHSTYRPFIAWNRKLSWGGGLCVFLFKRRRRHVWCPISNTHTHTMLRLSGKITYTCPSASNYFKPIVLTSYNQSRFFFFFFFLVLKWYMSSSYTPMGKFLKGTQPIWHNVSDIDIKRTDAIVAWSVTLHLGAWLSFKLTENDERKAKPIKKAFHVAISVSLFWFEAQSVSSTL